MADGDDRVDEALDALRRLPVPDRWDDVVARAAAGEPVGELVARRRRRRPPWLAAAAAVLVAAGAVAVVAADGDGTTEVDVATPSTATTVAGAPVTATSSCGTVTYAGDADLRADGEDLRGTADGHDVEVAWPAGLVRDFVGERVEETTIEGRPAVVWFREPGRVEVRMETGRQDPPCDRLAVTAAGGDDAELRAAAVAVAAALQVTADPGCADLRLTSPTIPPGFAASIAADGAFEGDGRSIDIRPGSIDGDPASVGPWAATVRDLPGAPQVAIGVPVDVPTCTLVATAHGGVTTQQVLDLLADAYLVDGERRPLLTRAALWPETAPAAVAREVPAGRDDPMAVVAAFGRAVLGWDDAVAVAGEPAHDGTGDTVLGLTRASRPDLQVTVRVAAALGGRWWSVTGVDVGARHDDPEAGATVQVSGSEATAGASLPPGAASSTVRFDYAGRIAEGTAGEPVELGFVPDTPGSVLVLFRDDAGEVVGAWGAALPAGDFAAS